LQTVAHQGKEKNWTGDRQVALTCEKVMFCAVWNKISSMQKGVYTVEIWIPRDAKRCENIRERDSRWTKYSNPAAHTLLNPRTPKSQCFSARVRKSDVGGLISFVQSIGANAPQVTFTLNFGGEGVVSDRKGLNISSIYGIHPYSIMYPYDN